MRIWIGVAALAMMVAGARGEDGAQPLKPGLWRYHYVVSAQLADTGAFDGASKQGRMQLPLLAHYNTQGTDEFTVDGCVEGEPAQYAVTLLDAVSALSEMMKDLPCTEPDAQPWENVLQCDYGGGITATRRFLAPPASARKFTATDELILKKGDTVVMHWSIREEAHWVRRRCPAKK